MAVTRLEVHSIRPFADGAVFGDTGPYRQIDGIVYLAVDPNHPANEVYHRYQAGATGRGGTGPLLRRLHHPAAGEPVAR